MSSGQVIFTASLHKLTEPTECGDSFAPKSFKRTDYKRQFKLFNALIDCLRYEKQNNLLNWESFSQPLIVHHSSYLWSPWRKWCFPQLE